MTNWTETDYPVAPWDTPGLPPRRMGERCAHHSHCAYRDDDPARCPVCHRRRKPSDTPGGCNHTRGTPNVSAPSADLSKTMPQGYGQCANCGEEWTGLAVAHCPTCHRTFTTVSAFDKHRTGSHTDDTG